MDSVAPLGHIEVLDAWGKPVFFRKLWQGKTTVMVLLRHFGCLFCHEQAATMLNALSSIEDAGADLIFLGNGNPAHAGEFMRRLGLSERVFTDPGRVIYRKLEMRHGLLRTLNLESSRHSRRALRGGYRQRGTHGDRWQQGGVLVIEPDGSVAFQHLSEVAGDHAAASDVLVVLRKSFAARNFDASASSTEAAS